MSLKQLFENNRKWTQDVLQKDPSFFETLAKQQTPDYLWIGCSDSRVPANEIIGLKSGEVFVHRNVANLVMHTDFNCLSVVQYAVEVLKVKHIMITGHYGCGGVREALRRSRDLGLIDNWLFSIRLIAEKHQKLLDAVTDEEAKVDLLCELNVIEQVRHLSTTSLLRHAWQRGHGVKVHGWIYGLKCGRLEDLGTTISNETEVDAVHDATLSRLRAKHGLK